MDCVAKQMQIIYSSNSRLLPMYFYIMKLSKLPFILSILIIVGLKNVYGIRGGDFTAEPLRIHDRSQVFISAPYGGVQGEGWRHGMGVLIHPQFILTAGRMLLRYNSQKIVVRVFN